MITIKYELYDNDFTRTIAKKNFANLEEMHDWIENNAYRPNNDWFYKIYYPYGDYNSRISFKTQNLNPFMARWCDCWIHLIENEEGILFTDGKFTRGQKHKSKVINELFDKWNKDQDKDFNFID